MHFIDDLIASRAAEVAQPSILACASGAAVDQYEYFTAPELDRLTNNAAHVLMGQGLSQPEASSDPDPVAILGTSNLEYLVNICALSRTGYSVLILSPRLSVTAYNSLLDQTACSTLLYMPEYADTVEKLTNSRATCLAARLMLCRADFDRPDLPQERVRRNSPATAQVSTQTAFIMHSSGSTGVPKSIFHTHKRCLENFQNGFGYSALITLPLYHTYGFSSFFRAIHGRTLMYLFNWNVPMTSKNVIRTLQAARPELLSTVPYTLGLLAESEEGIAAMAHCKMVTSHGSACPDELGDRLVRQGVYLVSHLGSTESGPLATSDRPCGDLAWNYLRFLPNVTPHIWMKPVTEDNDRSGTLYELVLLSGLKTKILSNSNDPPDSFHSRDLFQPHPTIPNAWKYKGRLDDRVTLTNGEKVLPLPIEGRVRQASLVREAIVFGVGRAVPGILIFRSPDAGGTTMTDDEFIEYVWPIVQEANWSAEAFSQIDKDMIVVLSADTPYPATDKGSAIRAQAYEVFAGVIEDCYFRREQLQEEGGWAVSEPETAERIVAFCETTLHLGLFSSDLHANLDANLYTAGLDSLKAIQLSVFLRKHFDLGGNSRSVTQNTIYECGSIRRLARLVCQLQTGHHDLVSMTDKAEDNDTSAIQALIDKYSQFERPGFGQIDQDCLNSAQPSRYHVLLTGVTGSLGAHVLAKFAQSPQTESVYCLIRQKEDDLDAMSRVIQSLQARKISLNAAAMQKVTALHSSPSKELFGLDPALFTTLKGKINLIIHAAWPVNFNLPLDSFESQMRGLATLIQFSLDVQQQGQSQPAKFLFCSSISVASRAPASDPGVPEELIPDFRYASRTGYARSKLVSEYIIGNAVSEYGADCHILRTGQIVGDSVHGIWTGLEAIPLMIQSAPVVQALPALDETCAWIPVDILAEIILELSFTQENQTQLEEEPGPQPQPQPALIYNLVNPRAFHWTRDLLPALKNAGLVFDALPPGDWVVALEHSSDSGPTRCPAMKLLSYFQYRYGVQHESAGIIIPPTFDTTNAQKYAPTLGAVPDLIQLGIIRRFVQAWNITGARGDQV
ncbi:hypothetical protein BDW75DRAFT_249668 [Aspergillus navahoensis]